MPFFYNQVFFQRGNRLCLSHWNSKIEKFLVISGKVKFKLKHILSDKEVEIIVDEKDNKIVDMIPGWAHKIENVR